MTMVDEQAQATAEAKGTVKITVCLSLSGVAEGAKDVYKEFEKQLAEMGANA
jgi:NADH:ubiquinone oxidoreductase subunit E